MYTTIESLTVDGRDRSLDYKISGFNVPRGSWDAKVVDALQPEPDDMVFAKSSCSVFQSTTVAYVLRNLDCKQLVLCGGLTDQCVESAVRDACDLGFLVTLVTDACYTETADRQASTLRAIKGYCRQRTTAQVIAELEAPEAAFEGPNKKTTEGSSGPPPLPGGGVKYVRFEVTDLNGKSVSKTIPARHYATDAVYMYSGMMALGANAEVLTFPEEVLATGCCNAKLVPDWTTLKSVPWATVPTARVLCDMLDCPAVPRTICVAQLAALKEAHGLELLAACEYEFSLAEHVIDSNDGTPTLPWKPHFEGVDIFATLQFQKLETLAYEIESKLYEAGIDVKTMNAEYGAGQVEITYAPSMGILSPDAGVLYKLAVKEIAAQHGLRASFMTKPFPQNDVGNGGHWNHSLWKDGQNVTFGEHESDKTDLSATASRWIDGILFHARALEALCAPTPPCYERHGHWAPTHANWGYEDRMASIRVKAARANAYMELRMPSAASNPYLVMAAVCAAGSHGLDDPDAKVVPRLAARLDSAEDAFTPLPTSLPEALEALEADEYIKGKLGPDFVRWFCLVKRGEMDAIRADALKFAKARDPALNGDAEPSRADTALAWQKLYMEYV